MKKIIIKIIILPLFLFSHQEISAQDTLAMKNKETDSSFQTTKSPWGAVLRSAIVPGWGQFYNESYLKIPVVTGILGWFAYNYFQNNSDYKKSRELYIKTGNSIYKSYREFYRDQRDLFAIYFGLAYLANLVDAYVDAQLFDFSVKEDFYKNFPMFEMRIKF